MQANPVEAYRSPTMIIDNDNESGSSEDAMLTTPSRKRSEKRGEGEKSKKREATKELSVDVESRDVANVIAEENPPEVPDSPIFIPTLSSPEPDAPEARMDAPIQSRASVDLVTFSALNLSSVTRLRQERDRLQFAGLRKRRSLLHQLVRSTWPALFMALRLRGKLPDDAVYESAADFETLRRLLYKHEDVALEALETQCPPQRSTSVVDMRSRVAWRVDPRLAAYLEQRGKAKRLTQTYHPSDEEEKTIIQSWKSSWSSKALGLISAKTQLKAALSSQQRSSKLEAFLQSLLRALRARAERLKEAAHLGESYDFRECNHYTNYTKTNKYLIKLRISRNVRYI